MKRVALTGGIGSGKSAVAARLCELGAVVIDADALAREVVAPGTDGLAALVEAFGPGILDADGSLHRPTMARLVFGDASQLALLEGITHPRIGARTAELIAQAEADAAPVVVYDVPLLVEKRLAGGFDAVVVVEAPRDLRLERLEGRGVARDDAEARMRAQATDAERREVADHLLDNSGDLASLHAQVDAVWAALRSV
jgi:dephospho-CoA kinase